MLFPLQMATLWLFLLLEAGHLRYFFICSHFLDCNIFFHQLITSSREEYSFISWNQFKYALLKCLIVTLYN